jgi:hypothetical protein
MILFENARSILDKAFTLKFPVALKGILTTLSEHTPSGAYLPAYTDSYCCGKWFFTNFIL